MLLPDHIRRVPKVDLHVHLEGTITPDLVKRIAHRNKITLPESLQPLARDVVHRREPAAEPVEAVARGGSAHLDRRLYRISTAFHSGTAPKLK